MFEITIKKDGEILKKVEADQAILDLVGNDDDGDRATARVYINDYVNEKKLDLTDPDHRNYIAENSILAAASYTSTCELLRRIKLALPSVPKDISRFSDDVKKFYDNEK